MPTKNLTSHKLTEKRLYL